MYLFKFSRTLIDFTMSNQSNNLTNTQVELIQHYYNKWLNIALENQKINRNQVIKAINNAYQLIGKKNPQIIFCDDLAELVFQIWLKNDSQPSGIKGVSKSIQKKLTLGTPAIEKEINQDISKSLNQLWNLIEPIENKLFNGLRQECVTLLKGETELSTAINNNWISSFSLIHSCLYDDYRISILNLPHDPWVWSIYKSLAEECFGFCLFKQVCFVLDRPDKIS